MAIRVVHQPVGAAGVAAFGAGKLKYARRKEEKREALQKEFRGMAFTQGIANQKYARDLLQTGQRQQFQLGQAQEQREFTAGENVARRAGQQDAATVAFDRGQDAVIAEEKRAEDRLAKQDEDDIERLKE